MIADTYCLGLGVTSWARRNVHHVTGFIHDMLVLSGVLFWAIVIILLYAWR